MSASFLPSIFVPLVGLVFPFVTLGLFFNFIEKEKIS
uniref:Photosystem I reaction center subunit VIII n=1 Tax=Monomorphina parapyrum TaxID=1664066 RepID=A0A0G3VID5_9EUGL|nr:photosystem I 4 kDa hydrophobic subunit [Monomorphina parapyrum]AKL78916.1 photosystem I 4 kDa hydrophobic subunit [Monomorphina parapyrum]